MPKPELIQKLINRSENKTALRQQLNADVTRFFASGAIKHDLDEGEHASLSRVCKAPGCTRQAAEGRGRCMQHGYSIKKVYHEARS